MALVFSNNAKSTLSGSIGADDTHLWLAPATGNLFAATGEGSTQLLTITDGTDYEIVLSTSRSGESDNVTIIRAQEGTTAKAWLTGSTVMACLTAGALATLGGGSGGSGQVPALNVNATTLFVGGNDTGLSFVPRESVLPPDYYQSYGKELIVRFPRTDIGVPPTWAAGTYKVGDIVISTADSRQYRAVMPVGGTVTSAASATAPTDSFNQFDTGVTLENDLVWVLTQPLDTWSVVMPELPSATSYFVPSEVGVLVSTDGSFADAANITVGNDSDGETWLLDNVELAVDTGKSDWFFRFPITDGAKVFSTYANPTWKVITQGTAGPMKATVWVKGFFLQADYA